jgi:hypothetical protein
MFPGELDCRTSIFVRDRSNADLLKADFGGANDAAFRSALLEGCRGTEYFVLRTCGWNWTTRLGATLSGCHRDNPEHTRHTPTAYNVFTSVFKSASTFLTLTAL